MFRSSFAENIFRSKYALTPTQTWVEKARDMVYDVCGGPGFGRLAPVADQDEVQGYIWEMKFLPAGRYIYYAGRAARFFNNCFDGATTVLTDKGFVGLEDNSGLYVNVLSPVDGQYYPAEIVHHGRQAVNELTFALVRGKSAHTYKVRATRNHHWLLDDGSDTYDIRVGDVVPANGFTRFNSLGYIHGLIFGDGTFNRARVFSPELLHTLRLCGAKNRLLDTLVGYLEENSVRHTVTYPPSASGDAIVTVWTLFNCKELPKTDDPSYVSGFIRGWLAADGCEKQSNLLASCNEEAIDYFVAHAACAGLVVTGVKRFQIRDTNFGKNHKIFTQSYAYGDNFTGFKLVSIQPVGEMDVYCPYEPVHGQIVIDHGIRTFNCFMLRGESDTREEWGELINRATSCLMTGGGIGVDYSEFRPKGKTLVRTGGTSSGPIPLMQIINEVGRNVCQGGSRRSAVYASLNWQHEDIQDFLVSKNWADMPIGNAGYTVADAKHDDFNYPAPLDMTNISLNYDDEWLAQINAGGLPETYVQNVRQALRTGEPGFSFNFGAQQYETLRNAPVSADTWVLLKTGYQQIAEIVDEPVEVWTGKQWATTVFKKTQEMVPTIVVEMTGGRFIKADPTHEFLVERWKGVGKKKVLARVDRVPASELVEGDHLHISLPTVDQRPDLIPEDYLNGFIFGDGSFCKKYPDRAEITFCTPEKQDCARNIGIEKMASCISVNWDDRRGYVRAYFRSPKFVGLAKNLFPDCNFFRDTDSLCSFLAGLFDADGSYDAKYARVRLASVEYGFLEGVRRALEQVGIISFINKSGRSGYGGRDCYLLVVAASSIRTFQRVIPTIRLKVVADDYVPYRCTKIKVLSLSEGPVEDVYCCDVGVEEHSFCAEGVIISNCCEITSADDSDVCNLGSVNMGAIADLDEFRDVVRAGMIFLLCGSIKAQLPYPKVAEVRRKNRRVGLGLMGVHEWLLQRGYRYEVVPELHRWLEVYRDESRAVADSFADYLGVSRPVGCRAVAPTGTIGILAGTTTGIEPLFAVAYKRRYLQDLSRWKYEYVIDSTAEVLIKTHGLNPEEIETANDLALDPERRIKFQYDVQKYVDHAISSTINLPEWGSAANNEDHVIPFARTLAKYAHGLRGFTCYPDGARGGQPITAVSYADAITRRNTVFEENSSCRDGVCGI